MVTVAAEVTCGAAAALFLFVLTGANNAVAGWIYQELHGNSGASHTRQVTADQQRRRGCYDAAHVRKGQWQRGGSVAFDMSRLRLNHRPSVRPSVTRQLKSFSRLLPAFAFHICLMQVGGKGSGGLRFPRSKNLRKCN